LHVGVLANSHLPERLFHPFSSACPPLSWPHYMWTPFIWVRGISTQKKFEKQKMSPKDYFFYFSPLLNCSCSSVVISEKLI
jgi:hypothetical protein